MTAEVLEIRFHGRGGQGAVIASEILAHAAAAKGHHVQSFPYFGVERRGAPVTAFTRLDDKPIRLRSAIYEPHHVVVLDGGLVRTVDVTLGLRPEGTVLVNAERGPDSLRLPRGRGATVDATGIALRHGLGTKAVPVVNTAILGAFVRVVPIVPLETLLTAIAEHVPSRRDENVAAAREAYGTVLLEVTP